MGLAALQLKVLMSLGEQPEVAEEGDEGDGGVPQPQRTDLPNDLIEVPVYSLHFLASIFAHDHYDSSAGILHTYKIPQQ